MGAVSKITNRIVRENPELDELVVWQQVSDALDRLTLSLNSKLGSGLTGSQFVETYERWAAKQPREEVFGYVIRMHESMAYAFVTTKK